MKGETTVRRLAAVFGAMAVLLLAGCDGDILHSHRTVGYRCLSFADVGFGPVRETWQCFDRFERVRSGPLVTLTRLGGDSDGYGEVSVADETHPAAFRVQGIDRRWNFGCDERDTAYPFAFVIKPDGTGLYYNFRPSTDGTATPSDLFDCVMMP